MVFGGHSAPSYIPITNYFIIIIRATVKTPFLPQVNDIS